MEITKDLEFENMCDSYPYPFWKDYPTEDQLAKKLSTHDMFRNISSDKGHVTKVQGLTTPEFPDVRMSMLDALGRCEREIRWDRGKQKWLPRDTKDSGGKRRWHTPTQRERVGAVRETKEDE